MANQGKSIETTAIAQQSSPLSPRRNPPQCHAGASLRWIVLTSLAGLTPLAVISPVLANPMPWGFSTETLTAQLPSNAKIIYVNSALGQDTATGGTEVAPLKSITYALQQAQPGTVIQLASGSYTKDNGEVFPLILKPGIILRGDEPNKGTTTTIIGGGAFVSPTFARQNITLLAAANSEIRGVNVTNPLSRGTGIWIEGTNPTIVNCTFANSVREGIFITGSANPTITDSVFLKNQGNGISIARTAQGLIRNNIMQDTGFGLAIGGTSTPRLENNQITQNQDGIYINDAAQPVLRGNVITNNQRDGVVATVNAKPDLGITGDDGNNTVRNNTKLDVNNAGSQEISAIGNNIDPKKISGKVVLVAKDTGVPIDDPIGGPTDIKGHWAEAFIKQLAAKNIIAGFPDGTFKPEAPVTRAQFAAIINKAFSPAPRRNAVEFSDVSTSFWGYSAIQTASKGGFMAGYPGGLFKPEQRIPRVQVLVALANGLQYGEGNVSILARYQDGNTIPSYATKFVASATQRRIVVNHPNLNLLNPNREATRAEVAAFVYQALVNAGKAEAISSTFIVNP
ncbi:DUF1565 domain-containing protein [Alkalinema sp. FACHB-956]|uniref:DUF1565 domain-containing protein n=1 Tax=Alkalinema sp. FACHB-956 TaxID=2692768 RepID=UPI00168751F7|nr:DUF1565 domain-containing protein [Alkalinema sp. FACHB-956]MBD2326058.1 DUF1565 domain-containing protein [Alkalinema sp. FACHB-956]